MTLFAGSHAIFDSILINACFALSQHVVMRAGIFSLASAAFAALGGYAAAILSQRFAVPVPLAWAAGIAVGMLAGLALSFPLARLRGVFQAIASITFVQLVQSVLLWAEWLTGGAGGLNGIPPLADTLVLTLAVILASTLLVLLGRREIGRSFDTIREDETLAVTLGIDVARTHRLAFVLSGGLGALGGIMLGFHDYSLMPDAFGFATVTNTLAYVVLGGSTSVAGALGGTVLLTILPEIARPLADNRTIAVGILLVLSITYLPHGFVDPLWARLRRRKPGLVLRADVS